jgi:hypothetical protein
MPTMAGTIEDSEILGLDTQRVLRHVRVMSPEEDHLPVRFRR